MTWIDEITSTCANFPQRFWHWGSTLYLYGAPWLSMVPAVWKVQRVVLREIMKKKKEGWNSWIWLGIAHCVLWPEMLGFTVLLLHAGSESVMVTNHPLLFPSSSRAEASGADTMGCGLGGPILNDQVVDIVWPWCKSTRLQVLRRLCVRGWSAEGLNCLTNTSLWLIVIKVCAQSQKNDTMAGCLF